MKYEYERILKEIETLPSGGITYKKINGKEYAYYQWRENGKQRSRRAKDDELERLTSQIQRRKQLKNILKEEGFVYKTSTAYFNIGQKSYSISQIVETFPTATFSEDYKICYIKSNTNKITYDTTNSFDEIIISGEEYILIPQGM
jgi:hypothetical protein